MDHNFEKNRSGNIHRQHDDWDEVHNQMLEVQRKGLFQKKSLAVSEPGDADEKEADEVARKVVGGESASIHGTGGTVNRKGEGVAEATPEFQTKLENSKGGGTSLPENVQEEMGSKMGADFSGVKVHTGSEAHAMNENVSAKAFAHGSDIYFRDGNYNPESSEGKELLAHELVHTVQQGDGKVQTKIQRVDYDYTKAKVETLEDILKVYTGLTATDADSNAVLPGAVIMQTSQFKELMNPALEWQKQYNIGYDEAIYVCRQVLKKLIAGTAFDWKTEIEGVIVDALKITASSAEETKFGTVTLAVGYDKLFDGFKTAIAAKKDISAIEAEVKTYAENLWKHKGTDGKEFALVDGSLYASRIQARMELKKHKELSKDKTSIQAMTRMFTLLDDVSRGRQDIVFADDDTKRILISGFDPYKDAPGFSNASGQVAMMLDGKTITYTEAGTTKTAQIQSTVFPTRYDEFDKGKVEAVYEPYLNPAAGHKVAMVVSISLDPNFEYYFLERHASSHRGGMADNADVGTEGMMQYSGQLVGTSHAVFYSKLEEGVWTNMVLQTLSAYGTDASITKHDWKYITGAILNKLKALFPSVDFTRYTVPMPDPVPDQAAARSYLRKVYVWLRDEVVSFEQQGQMPAPVNTAGSESYYTTTLKTPKGVASAEDILTDNFLRVRDQISYYKPYVSASDPGARKTKHDPDVPAEAKVPGAANTGSGGSYLSNEMHYRVSALGAKYKHAVPNIHLHIPPVGGKYSTTINMVEDNVKKAIQTLIEAQL